MAVVLIHVLFHALTQRAMHVRMCAVIVVGKQPYKMNTDTPRSHPVSGSVGVWRVSRVQPLIKLTGPVKYPQPLPRPCCPCCLTNGEQSPQTGRHELRLTDRLQADQKPQVTERWRSREVTLRLALGYLSSVRHH